MIGRRRGARDLLQLHPREGGIHGDEKIGWAVAFEMLKYMVANHNSDTLVTRLIDTRELWFHPMYNPDGYDTNPARRYNGNNVDLNRNWGWMWGWEYNMGDAPFSEPENRAVLDHILRHPEYHAILADSAGALEKEWTPEGGQSNPFLHLSLHLAIHEQISIDQPPGIRAAYDTLRAKMDAHDAEHILLECLGETIWRAQRQGTPMDAAAYVDAVRRKGSLI